MGYYATGDITFTIPEHVEVALALSSEKFSRERYGDFIPDEGQPPYLYALTYEGFESYDQYRDEDGSLVVSTRFDTKWRNDAEKLLRQLAETGAGVEGQMRGEDDALWGYMSAVGAGRLVEDRLLTVPQSTMDTYIAAQDRLNKLAETLTRHPDWRWTSTQILDLLAEAPQAAPQPAWA